MRKLVYRLTISIMAIVCMESCSNLGNELPYSEIPKGVLIDRIPVNMDIMFTSVRGVLQQPEFYDRRGRLLENFLDDPTCNSLIYDSEDGQLVPMKQIFLMDSATGEVVQATNLDLIFIGVQAVNETTLVALAIGEDTDNNGKVNDQDQPDICMIHLDRGEVEWLTEDGGLNAINNMDYSVENGLILFSAQPENEFHNYLFTLSLSGELTQLTHGAYMDFDCSWSANGKFIVFSRLPEQDYPFTIPSEIWMMKSDGTDMRQITDGGTNPEGEEPFGPYPIGIDADPHLNGDNTKVVFSRLVTGRTNTPFGNYVLLSVDLTDGSARELVSEGANMLPEWGREGILFIEQSGKDVAEGEMPKSDEVFQSLALYNDGAVVSLETYPYNLFPLGAYSCSRIDFRDRIYTNRERLESIPEDIVKGTPENDDFPPVLHSNEFEYPVPLEVVTSAGAGA